MYFNVCGGPFGFEYALLASSPAFALWGLLLVALVWALPQALIVAELSSQLPHGYNEVVVFFMLFITSRSGSLWHLVKIWDFVMQQ